MGGGIVAIVPAAGHGSRMQNDVPKQYLPLGGESVIGCTLKRLQRVHAIIDIVVVVAENDYSDQVSALADVHVTVGGTTRAASVLEGLKYIQQTMQHTGMVMVHDAARPCVRVADIDRLIEQVADYEHGGILAVPVHDTLKRGNGQFAIQETVQRHDMWRAVTPQLFPLGRLYDALLHASTNGSSVVTDEASAMEYAGYSPRLVAGSQDNIKITVADDLALAEAILNAQERP